MKVDIVHPFVMNVVGPKRAGKTTFLREFIVDNCLDLMHYIFVLSPTAKYSRDFDFLRDQRKCKFRLLMTNLDDEMDDIWSNIQEACDRNCFRNVLVILDDCATERMLNNSGIVSRKSIMHRHFKTSLISVGHAYRGEVGLPKALRLQSDYVVFFNPASIKELEQILEDTVFKEDRKVVKQRAREIFSDKYNYIVYTPAASYYEKLRFKFGEPLLTMSQLQTKAIDKSTAVSDPDKISIVNEAL